MSKRRITYYKQNIKEQIEKRFNIIIGFVIIAFSFLSIGLITLQVGSQEKYKEKLKQATEKIIFSDSVPRGRIYDRNYNLLVDNVGEKVIYYQKQKGIKTKDEISLAYEMAKIIDVPYNKLTEKSLKEFWLINNVEAGNRMITGEEYRLYDERKLSDSDLKRLKLERITDQELSTYTVQDKEAAYIYYLMNKGYAYDEHIIKDVDVNDKEYAYISENSNQYPGFKTKLDWERKYLYGDVLKGILGTVSDSSQGIPYELKQDYLKKGYALNDRVGLSNLEYEYENLLRGQKSVYKMNSDNSLELLKQGTRGNDIVLTIDINLQIEAERIMEEEMLKTKNQPNTDYYNRSFVIISDPNTGQILAYVGKQIVYKDGNYVFYDYTPNLTTTTVTVGSVIKGASMSTGYSAGAIDIGSKFLDQCIKLKNTPAKCSWTNGLGVLDDVTALKYSSNSYQFQTAMRVAGVAYKYNMPLVVDPKAFATYRNMFAEFGLGVKTGIDLPNEGTGYKGGSDVSGHLLDFSIGQYDTYTPIQLVQYINTIANGGKRIQLHFLKEVHEPTMLDNISKLESTFQPKIYNDLTLDHKYIDRIRYSFTQVMNGNGLGVGYMGYVSNPAGKTGTAQSFVDSDNDGKVDKETLTNTFAGYYPTYNPVMSIVAISPDIYNAYHNSTYRTLVNKRLSSEISNKFFDIYK